MTPFAAHQASLHFVEAAILGAEVGEAIEPRLKMLIETAVRTRDGARLTYALKAASRTLAAADEHLLAARCFLLPDVGPFDPLPRLALDHIDDDVWDAAAAEELDIYQIARHAADALGEIIAAEQLDRIVAT